MFITVLRHNKFRYFNYNSILLQLENPNNKNLKISLNVLKFEYLQAQWFQISGLGIKLIICQIYIFSTV